MTLASICRFGNQDIFRLLGRDPYTQPLSPLEEVLFHRAIIEIVKREYDSDSSSTTVSASEYPTELDESLLSGNQ